MIDPIQSQRAGSPELNCLTRWGTNDRLDGQSRHLQRHPRTLEDIKNTSFVSFLDLARWAAAAIVFLGHLRNPLFLGYASLLPEHRGLFVKAWFFVTGWHAEAVIVFFILSGYLVGALALAKAAAGRFNPIDYAVDRATRLFLPLIPALGLTAGLDAAGSALFADLGFYTHTHPMIREKVATEAFQSYLTPEIFLSNMAMLQTIWAPSFGSNQPLWTISLEFWFYVVFGLALTASLASGWLARIVCLFASAVLLAALGTKFVVFIGLWLIGAGVGLLRSSAVERPVTALLLFLGVLVAVRVNGDAFDGDATLRVLRDYLIAGSFAWLLLSVRQVRLRLLQRFGRFNRFMAGFSYSLYLIHFPLMLFVLGALHSTGYFEGIAHGYSATDARGLVAYVIAIAVVGTSAWLFAKATEQRTWRLRRALKRLFRLERVPESI